MCPFGSFQSFGLDDLTAEKPVPVTHVYRKKLEILRDNRRIREHIYVPSSIRGDVNRRAYKDGWRDGKMQQGFNAHAYGRWDENSARVTSYSMGWDDATKAVEKLREARERLLHRGSPHRCACGNERKETSSVCGGCEKKLTAQQCAAEDRKLKAHIALKRREAKKVVEADPVAKLPPVKTTDPSVRAQSRINKALKAAKKR